jgi:hypothetical protein
MKSALIILAGLATAGSALAQVDPTHLMIVGVGNANAKPGDVIVTNQTASPNSSSADTTTLEKFVVTGSLLGHDRKGAAVAGSSGAPAPASTSKKAAAKAASADQGAAAPRS